MSPEQTERILTVLKYIANQIDEIHADMDKISTRIEDLEGIQVNLTALKDAHCAIQDKFEKLESAWELKDL